MIWMQLELSGFDSISGAVIFCGWNSSGSCRIATWCFRFSAGDLEFLSGFGRVWLQSCWQLQPGRLFAHLANPLRVIGCLSKAFLWVCTRLPNLQERCPSEWYPSRLESECITGDSMTFYFPHTTCSPFENPQAGRIAVISIRQCIRQAHFLWTACTLLCILCMHLHLSYE